MTAQEIAVRLHEAAARDKCICGEPRGHTGWLVCELADLRNPAEFPSKQADQRED